MDNRNLDADIYEKSIRKKRKSRAKIIFVTAVVVLVTLLVNIAFSVLAYRFMLHSDLTNTRYTTDSSRLYTLTDITKNLIAGQVVPMIDKVNAEREAAGEDRIKLNIIFCADRDLIEDDELMRYISYTARQLEVHFPKHVSVEYVNITKNPTAVQKYKITSAANIYPSNVIVEFGSEYTVLSYKSFFTANSDNDAPWAYNGEKRFAASILSVTRAESPICCITTNHGEEIYGADGNIREEYSTFIAIIEGSGYVVQPIDLETDEIPKDCRMIVTFNPREDFHGFGNLGESGVSEIEKLDKFLDGSNTLLYVADPDSPRLPNLDEYLEEWGIRMARESVAGDSVNHVIRDNTMNIDEGGTSVLGQYTTTGMGAAINSDLISLSFPPKAVFSNTTHILPSDTFTKAYVVGTEQNGLESYEYYSYYKNGVARNLYNIFTTYNSAEVLVDGRVFDMASDDKLFSLMTITEEKREVQEDSYNTVNNASYVLAVASTEFFSNGALDSKSYGNTDILLSALRHTSREMVPVNIEFKPFYIYDMQAMVLTQKQATACMMILALLPSIALFTVGAVVCIRRRNR